MSGKIPPFGKVPELKDVITLKYEQPSLLSYGGKLPEMQTNRKGSRTEIWAEKDNPDPIPFIQLCLKPPLASDILVT